MNEAIKSLKASRVYYLSTDEITVNVSRDALDETLALVEEMAGALNFILAFYEPGQRYLDTNAWKIAEAGGREALRKSGFRT